MSWAEPAAPSNHTPGVDASDSTAVVMPFLSIASMSCAGVHDSCTPKCGILRASSQSAQAF